MNRNFTSGLMSLAAAGSLLAVNQAGAQSETFVTSTPIPSSLTDWSGSLAFQQFNPSLGTLDSVTLTLSSSLSTTLTVVNSASDASSGTVRTELLLTPAPSNLADSSLDIITSPQSYGLASGQSLTLPLVNRTGSSVNTYSDSTTLGQFTGSGTFSVGVGTFTQTLLANTGGNTSSSQVTVADATGTVVYDYTPFAAIPEPSGYAALAGLCAMGMLGLSRRGNRK